MRAAQKIAGVFVNRSPGGTFGTGEATQPDLADEASATQQLEEYLASLTRLERDDLIALIRQAGWQPVKSVFPQKLQDGSRTGWFHRQLLMRKRINGSWVYRMPTPAERECEDHLDGEFQVW